MAIVADYQVITKLTFKLQLGASPPVGYQEISFQFNLPAGAALQRGEPLLHYTTVYLYTPGYGNQMGIAVDVNGTEVDRRLFIEGSRNVLVEAILNPSPFHATGQNAIRFKPVSPTNDVSHYIMFQSVVLLFQRDSTALG